MQFNIGSACDLLMTCLNAQLQNILPTSCFYSFNVALNGQSKYYIAVLLTSTLLWLLQLKLTIPWPICLTSYYAFFSSPLVPLFISHCVHRAQIESFFLLQKSNHSHQHIHQFFVKLMHRFDLLAVNMVPQSANWMLSGQVWTMSYKFLQISKFFMMQLLTEDGCKG